jgi:hypothetical protein
MFCGIYTAEQRKMDNKRFVSIRSPHLSNSRAQSSSMQIRHHKLISEPTIKSLILAVPAYDEKQAKYGGDINMTIGALSIFQLPWQIRNRRVGRLERYPALRSRFKSSTICFDRGVHLGRCSKNLQNRLANIWFRTV